MRTILPLAPLALVVLALHTSAAQAANPPGTGDINGDGVADILMGDDGATPGRPGAGAVRVVFGAKGAKRSLKLAKGFRIIGAAAHDGLARDGDYMRGIAGDVNGDGLDDVIVGDSASPQGRKRAGAAYVVFGKRDTRDVDLAALGDAGLEIQGPVAGG
ncbi:MAG TPA: FG-GAP and VCBS repeat-containing protein, partial [Solirubrobacter sp.]